MIATLTAIAIGLAAAGTTASVIGQVKAGNAAKKLGEFNARIAEQQSQDALDRGKLEEQKFRQGAALMQGANRAGYAGQNVDISTGSAIDVEADAAYWAEVDAHEIRTNAAREAWGYKVEAEDERMRGKNAQSASRYGAAATALGGGASIASAYSQARGGGSSSKSTGDWRYTPNSHMPPGAGRSPGPR